MASLEEITNRMLKLEIAFAAEIEDTKEFRTGVSATLKEFSAALQDLKVQREKQMSFIGGISAVISIFAGAGAFIVNKYF
jgi:hypothetical protein